MKQIPGSFRDPSGQVFLDNGRIVRTINSCYREHWQQAVDSGLLEYAVESGKMPSFTERCATSGEWKCLDVERIPFITYPYEWCFSQLRDAALLTLQLQHAALERGMILKDASAFNVQFIGPKPVFIDMLSFETLQDGVPWHAYRQFCMHFLAPVALQAYLGLWCSSLSRNWIDGIPISHACAMLPFRVRFKPGLALHLFAHAHMERRHADTRVSAAKAGKVRVSRKSLQNLTTSLTQCIEGIRLPAQKTQWGDYYADTNYSSGGAAAKLAIVGRIAKEYDGGCLAVDLGANTGVYSAALAPHFKRVLAVDSDPLAVERHYLQLKSSGPGNILPLVVDLGNPSPALGWASEERESFQGRCSADFVMALALVHHLVIAAGIPLYRVAGFFASLLKPGGRLLVEFVPKEDSQVQRLLAARNDIFEDYTIEGFRRAFEPDFAELEVFPLPDSARTLHYFKKLR